MKKVLLATTAVAAFVAFSGTAQAQDPGRADVGATEGGGGAGSAFTVKVGGDISFFLKYATGSDEGAVSAATKAELADAEKAKANDGLFALISGELHINGAATTDNGTDIDTHLELEFSGIGGDSTRNTAGSASEPIPVGDIVRVDELSVKIGGGWGSVELGANDGAEDIFKLYGGTVGAGTGGVDGFAHTVDGGVGKGVTIGGTAGSGDSSDALKLTYLSPSFVGIQLGASLNYQTEGPNDTDGGVLGVGVGAKYSGSAGGFDYAVSVIWGDTAITGASGGVGLGAEASSKSSKDALTAANAAFLSATATADVASAESEAAKAFAADATLDSSGVATGDTAADLAVRAAAAADTAATALAAAEGDIAAALGAGTAPSPDQLTAVTTATTTKNKADAALAAADRAKDVADAAAPVALAATEAANEALTEAENALIDSSGADEAAEGAGKDAARGAHDADYGGLGIGIKLGGAGVSGVFGVTLDKIGRSKEIYAAYGGSEDDAGIDIHLGTGVAYAIPGGKSNVSVTAALSLPYDVPEGETEADNHLNAYTVFASADYAVLPGVTLAVDLGYGDSDVDDKETKSGGFTGAFRVKAAF